MTKKYKEYKVYIEEAEVRGDVAFPYGDILYKGTDSVAAREAFAFASGLLEMNGWVEDPNIYPELDPMPE